MIRAAIVTILVAVLLAIGFYAASQPSPCRNDSPLPFLHCGDQP